MVSILRIITITTAVLMLIGISWLFFSGKLQLINTQEVSKSFSQFINLEAADEYVIARLETNEEFITEKYNYVMGFPVGDTNVKLALVAHYKYYIKLAELTHNAKNGIVFIHVPKLYLSTPIAFEFSTVRESWSEFLFGPDGKELLDQLKKEVSGKLITKGQSQISVVYDKAAKALADNLNSYFNANVYGRYYKNIVVIFASEHSQSQRQFNYNSDFCGKESCSLKLDLGKGRIFTIQ
ncbi:MAG: hypothetical protein LUQ29_09025 [Methylococcaceae bacterium]|nr:hypothetical protein [Methylococcaceae bacterium]